MLTPSLVLVLVVVAGGIAALVALGWAVARGWVTDDAIRDQASCIFEGSDLRDERPWETAAQRAERAALHGMPTDPRPGAYGGAR